MGRNVRQVRRACARARRALATGNSDKRDSLPFGLHGRCASPSCTALRLKCVSIERAGQLPDVQTLSGPLPQSGSPARDAKRAARLLPPHLGVSNVKMGRNVRQRASRLSTFNLQVMARAVHERNACQAKPGRARPPARLHYLPTLCAPYGTLHCIYTICARDLLRVRISSRAHMRVLLAV